VADDLGMRRESLEPGAEQRLAPAVTRTRARRRALSPHNIRACAAIVSASRSSQGSRIAPSGTVAHRSRRRLPAGPDIVATDGDFRERSKDQGAARGGGQCWLRRVAGRPA
jgi:hypothetical protein